MRKARSSTSPERKSRLERVRGFTLVEVLIVIAVLGILAAIVTPELSSASQSARENTLKDDLRYLRQQIIVYKAQHRDVAPGYPGGDPNAVPTIGDFTQQTTGYTNDHGIVGAPSSVFRFGPYLTKMPANPINNLRTVLVVANGAALPAPDNSTGWIYKPQSQEIIPNLAGTDSNGVRYIDY